MKKYILSVLFISILAWSCKEEFTEQTAFGSLSDESLKNKQGVELLLVGAYSALDGLIDTPDSEWSKTGDNWWFDALSDDAHKGSNDGDQPALTQLEAYTWDAGNEYFLGKWRALYAGVNRANAVINQINLVEGEELTQQLAEARFLRGFFYFELQKIFGNPAYISEENFKNLEFNQPNTGPVWAQIEADYQFAIDNLEPMNEQGQIGKPNSWTAKAFLGKTYVYQGKYSEAFTVLNDVIQNGPYDLLPEFADNFRLKGEGGVESVFAIQFTADPGNSWNGNRGGTLNFPGVDVLGTSCCGFYLPSQDLVNAYQTNDGLPLFEAYNDQDVKNDSGLDAGDPFTPHAGPLDPRLDYTIGRRGIDFNGYGKMQGGWIRGSEVDLSSSVYLAKKSMYTAGDDANRGTGDWGQQRSGINYHIMRFADVLLLAAEAAVETGDLTTALGYVNRVRTRAKDMTYVKDGDDNAANYSIEAYASFPDQAYARKAVRFERRLEFGMEGQRLFDLRRWGISAEVLNEYVQSEKRTFVAMAKVNQYQPHYDLCPIPIDAIDSSVGVLQQNPGY